MRKHGGIWFLSIGPFQASFCIKRGWFMRKLSKRTSHCAAVGIAAWLLQQKLIEMMSE